MSVLKTFVEKQSYYNYNGTLDINKYDLYVPIILNKKYTNKSEFEKDFEDVKKKFFYATLVEIAY